MLIDRVREFIIERDLLSSGERVIVGVSGGVDSVVLLDVLLHLGYQPVVVHVNYRLRGKDAEDDEEHVRILCSGSHIRLRVERFDTASLANQRKRNVQELARELRLNAFTDLARHEGIRSIAVGQHLDDQVETVFLNLFRGTGPEGLAGMPVKRNISLEEQIHLIRPLLCVYRSDIERYAREKNLMWRIDRSNTSTKYKRNAIRRDIIPRIKKYFGPSALQNIVRSSELVRDYVDHVLKPLVEVQFDDYTSEKDETGLDAIRLLQLPSVWRRRLLLEAVRRWFPETTQSMAVVRELEKMLSAQPGKKVVFGQGTIWRERDKLLFVPKEGSNEHKHNNLHEQLHLEGEVILPHGTVGIKLMPDVPSSLDTGSETTVFVNADILQFPLVVRRWVAGDRFKPFGMQKEKKVSDFLTDIKVPPHQRSDVYVVVSGKKIVWVIGKRLAEDVRVRPDAEKIAKLYICE